MARFDGKVAFITGVARGMGRAQAIRMAEEGADIVGVDIAADIDTVGYSLGTQQDLDETARLVEKAGRTALLSRTDVRDYDGLADAVTWSISAHRWRDVIDVNLTGVFNTLSATIPLIRNAGNGGSVIVTALGGRNSQRAQLCPLQRFQARSSSGWRRPRPTSLQAKASGSM